MRKESVTPSQVDAALNKKSGVLGISGKYTDRRDLEIAANSGEERARLAMDIEGYRLKKYVGAYSAALGRVDAVVFTAGVGERGPATRQAALQGVENMGIILDADKNAASQTRYAETEITARGSRVRVFVIPTDEELVMTEDTVALIQGTYDVHTRFTYSFQDKRYANAERLEALEEDLRKNPALKNVIARAP
jgi:acetate kinase